MARPVEVAAMEWLDAERRHARRGAPQHVRMRKPLVRALCACALSLAMLTISLANVLPVPQVQAAASFGLPPTASCAALGGMDSSATNGAQWGRTIFAGHNSPGGWFGVDVCGNGVNAAAPNGANVSCDRIPDNWAKTGCAPGGATSDGYGLTFQCVELIIRFSYWAFGDSVSAWGRSGNGNAPDLWLPENHPSDFVIYPNGSGHAPVPGDILVWGELDANGRPLPAGADGEHGGHIAVVAAVHDGVVITAEQNVKWGADDHPTDTLALTKYGSQWILSGSNRRTTSLPTYRWQSTMGTARGTYGWLHNIHNTGTFPARNVHGSTVPAKPTATVSGRPSNKPSPTPGSTSTAGSAATSAPAQQSGGLPSLADSTVVTSDGILADLSWSKTDLFATATTGQGPSAHVRSLGAPPGTHLIANQTVSTVDLSDGSRYAYAVGADGKLYSARTAPDLIGVQWTNLGVPDGVQLQPATAASTYAGGVGIAVLAADGDLWWRAGPASSPGGWIVAGHPDGTTLAGSFALAGQPGSGAPLLLALGQDGRIYERIWEPALLNGDGSVQVPAGWSTWLALHAQLPAVHLTGKLLVVSELQYTRSWVGSWPDAPIDLIGADALGNLWAMRSVTASSGWTFGPMQAPHAVTALFAAVAVAHTTTDGKQDEQTAALHIYAATVAGPYLAAVALPAPTASASSAKSAISNTAQPVWTKLAPLPQDMTSAGAGTALNLGTDASAFVASMGDSVLVGGSSDATSALAATDTVSISAPSGANNVWMDLGSVSGAAPFADTLTGSTVDRRWYLAGTGATATGSSHGLRLATGSAGVAALLQSTTPGDASAQVQVALPTSGGTGATAGLLLYLDGSDWLTLTVNGSGRVSLCSTAREVAAPCQGTTLKQRPSTGTLWLRVARSAESVTGSYSADGQRWTTVGMWSAPASPAAASGGTTTHATATVTPGTPSPAPARARAAATATASATPASASTQPATTVSLAPLAFTQWGLYVNGDPTTTGWPEFQGFVIVPPPTGQ